MIDNLIPPKASILPTQQKQIAQQPKKQNQLGLTPGKVEDLGSEGEDDEAKLAKHEDGQGLQIEYRGQKSTLSSAADIAAWIAERRKRFPTAEKAEAAKKEAAERKKKWEEEKKARQEAGRQKREERQQQRNEQEKALLKDKLLAEQKQKQKSVPESSSELANQAKLKAEKLRRRALKAQRDLEKAEEALRKVETEQQAGPSPEATRSDLDALITAVDDAARSATFTATTNGDKPVANIATTVKARPEAMEEADNNASSSVSDVSDPTETDYTSSSGSDADSGSESDSAPEEAAIQRSAPGLVSVEPPSTTTPGPCSFLLKYGRCKYGTKCQFSHDVDIPGRRTKDKRNNIKATPPKRKGLYQIMVEKEREEEEKRVLRAIVALGEAGVLDEHTEAKDRVSKVDTASAAPADASLAVTSTDV